MIEKIITFEDIKKANESIITTDIKGKDYAEVNQRIKAFRQVYPTGTIKTDILSLENGVVTMRTEIYDGDKLLGTGLAQEKEGSTFINKTSYIENCETSSTGRALAMCGFGIDTSIASKEEVENAISNQKEKQTKSNPKTGELNSLESLIDYQDNNQDVEVQLVNLRKKFEVGKAMLKKMGFDIEDIQNVVHITQKANLHIISLKSTDVYSLSHDELKRLISTMSELYKKMKGEN